MTRSNLDPWLKAGIAGGLAYLWRGPLVVVALAILGALAVGELFWPIPTTFFVIGVVAWFMVHHSTRGIRRRL